MEPSNSIKLKSSSIFQVPLNVYEKNFTFIVNGKEFRTNHFISDILSPKISQIHSNDPLFDVFTINTNSTGDFSRILDLINFNTQKISEEELNFTNEIIELLGNESFEIEVNETFQEITSDNIIPNLQKHDQYSYLFKKQLSAEIDYASSHFYELSKINEEGLLTLSISTIERIISNDKLRLTDEDQLLTFINRLYVKNQEFEPLFEYICFVNISSEKVHEFIETYDPSSMNIKVWNSISKRLERNVIESKRKQSNRYLNEGSFFEYNEANGINGIINHLTSKSLTEIEITSSSCYDKEHLPINSISYNNDKLWFASKHLNDQYLQFDFKEHRVIPTEYTIKSYCMQPYYPRSWVIMGSPDGKSWEYVDFQYNCSFLNGKSYAHTFKIKNVGESKFKYIRMQMFGKNWGDSTSLELNSFEIYGTLI